MKKFNDNKSILFWITGLSGSGKTVIAQKINDKILLLRIAIHIQNFFC